MMSQLPDFLFDRVSAEIQQQMAGVLALADRLAHQPTLGETQAYAASVAESAVSVQRILSRASELRAADANGLVLAPEPRQLRELMDAIEAEWQARAASSEVTLLVAYDGDPEACATVDGLRLIQLFDGLIGQTAAAVRRGAVEASLKVSTAGDGLNIEGRVRGGGERGDFDSADVHEIEARYGLETALGAALSRRILQALGGALRREANAGAGETLVFEFTVATAQLVQPDTDEGAETPRSAHILVVDDNATNRMVAQTLCEMFDCTSESAGDGVEAVEAARTGRFDLILMDIKMPRMDGVAATRLIRGLSGRVASIPIIALTANADPDDAAGYLAAGMNGVVEKPMKPETLFMALQQALAEAEAAVAA